MKLLIAEDDPVSRRLLEAKLVKWGYEVIATPDGTAALQVLQGDDPPRLAIIDWMMPGLDGVEVCRRIRLELNEPYSYLILLTALQQEQDIVAGMEAGADDYITKPFKDNELRVRLRAGRRIIDLQNELIAAREALRLRATHDPLTGLWNHEEILGILKQELDRANREGLAVSVVMADLDHFKKVNDTYGHLTGDAVLRTAARRLQEAVRSYDSIGRYGGEEFLIVLPGCAGPCSAAAAERLLHCIGNKVMDTPEGMITVTVSLGIAGTGEGMLLDADALVKAADLALYQAKENGRNRFEIASGGICSS